MKILLWIVVTTLLAVFAFSLRIRFLSAAHGSMQPASGKANPQTYVDLRNMMLQGSRQKFGLPPASNPSEPFAVLMDWGVPNGKASVVAIADGTASVYLSSGGGFIGGGQSNESIRNAAKRTVSLASAVQSQMHGTTTYPLPETHHVTFYVLTDAGVFTASASEDELKSEQSPFTKLGNSAQDIITEYRLTQQ